MRGAVGGTGGREGLQWELPVHSLTLTYRVPHADGRSPVDGCGNLTPAGV